MTPATPPGAPPGSGIGGLIAILGDAPAAAIDAAVAAAPWRGPTSTREAGANGVVIALGDARAGRAGHLLLGWGGRMDNAADLASVFGCDPTDPVALLAALYARDGAEFARAIKGDFAAVVLDDERGRLVGARDWIAVRPLFWGRTADRAVLASEVKQVLSALDSPLRPDDRSARSYLHGDGQWPLDHTFSADVRAVLPCGQVQLEPGRPPQAWATPVRFEPIRMGLAEAAAELRLRLDTAVARRVAGARRVGALLSGGMDSTSVAASATVLHREGGHPPVAAAFTASYPHVPSCDETAYASEVARFLGLAWQPVVVADEDLRAFAEKAWRLHDGPSFPASGKYDPIFAAATAAEIDVILTGEGGSDFLEQRGRELRQSILRSDWRDAAGWVPSYWRRSPRATLREIAGATKRKLLDHDRAEAYWELNLTSYWVRFALEFLERTGAFYGIRVESPLFDIDVAALLSGLPAGVLSSVELDKQVLREAMRSRLPASVLRRPTYTYLDELLESAFGPLPAGETPYHVAARFGLAAFMEGTRAAGEAVVHPTSPGPN